jgi:hypothetical protein
MPRVLPINKADRLLGFRILEDAARPPVIEICRRISRTTI